MQPMISHSPDTHYSTVLVNALSNYGGYFVNVAVGFFMQAFLVRRLGSDQYSIVPLVMSCVNYLLLMNLGIGMGMNRFLSAARARGDEEEITRISTSIFFVMVGLGIILLMAGGLLAWNFNAIFTIAPRLQKTAMVVMLLMAASAAVQLPFSILSAAFIATQKYTLKNLISSGTTLLNAALILALFTFADNWVVWVAASQAITALIRIGCQVLAVRRILPSMQIKPSFFSRRAITSVWTFSIIIFLGQLGGLLYWHTDYIIINKVLTAYDLTIYAVAVSLATYIYQLAQVPISTLFPVIAGFEARGSINKVPGVVYRGTRLCILVALPFCIVVSLFAEPLFRLYLGPQYSGAGEFVPIIMVTIFFASASCVIRQVPIAIGRPVFISILEIGCAVINIGLTLLFVLRFNWGLAGVAWGTAIAVVLKNGVIIPWYLTLITDLKLTRLLYHVLRGLTPPAIIGVVLVGAVQLIDVTSILASVLSVGLLTVPYILIAYAIGLDDTDRELVGTFWNKARAGIIPSVV